MTLQRLMITVFLLISCATAWAQPPELQAPLPALDIADRGEIQYQDNEFSFTPWNSGNNPGKVHIVQYFGGTKGDSKIFEPFTDLLQETFELGTYHVTTIINLDAALWGTTGFVVSEVKENKRKHPGSTLVLDEEGTGAVKWQLGDKGAGLAILDEQGIVRYFTTVPMSTEELSTSLDLVRANIDS
jgi:YtfJ family uncharacterized protein